MNVRAKQRNGLASPVSCATLILRDTHVNCEGVEMNVKGLRTVNGASLVVALLQSLCTAVLTISESSR